MKNYYEPKKTKNLNFKGSVYEKKRDPKTGFWEEAWHDKHCKGWKIIDKI